MEHTLGVLKESSKDLNVSCLNPCFNGTYSRRFIKCMLLLIISVLILVLMEHTLGVSNQQANEHYI